MSLYNALHGVNPFAALLIGMAGVRFEEIPRFRDVFIAGEEGNRRIAIYTRTGGGNRTCYCNDPWYLKDAGRTEPWPLGEHRDGCYPHMNRQLAKKPLYDWDEDDDFDSTYATFYFKVPTQYAEAVEDLVSLGGQTTPPGDAMQALIAKLQAGVEDEETEATTETMRPIIEKLAAALEEGDDGREGGK